MAQKLAVKVITRSKKERVELQLDGGYKVWVRAVPEKGRANRRVIELLAEHFQKPISSILIIQGQTSNQKLIEIV